MLHRLAGLLMVVTGFSVGLTGCEEADPCADVTCSGHGECLEADGEPACFCHSGYSSSGTECLGTNACLTGTHECDAHAACYDEDPDDGVYSCTCLNGFVGDGYSCANVDECAAGTDDCDANSTCVDTPGSYACICHDGWVESGGLCVDVDECAVASPPCPATAECVNTDGGFDCVCDPGYVSDGTICKRKKVLVLGIDGLRPDALAAADVTPELDELIATGLYSDRAQSGDLTDCGPGWTTILTGVWRDKHGVNDDLLSGYDPLIDPPPIFTRLRTTRPSLETVWINSLPALAPLGINADTEINLDFATGCVDDSCVMLEARDQLQNEEPDVLFVYFASVEQAGLSAGFHPGVGAYTAQIETVDALIGQLRLDIENRTTFAQEAWMILVTSDHGGGSSAGTLTSHGNDAPGDRRVPFIVYAPDLVDHGVRGEIFPAPTIADVAPTIFAYLDINELASWGWDGDPILAESAPPAPAFATNLIYNPNAELDRGFSDLSVDGTTSGWLESGGVSPVLYGQTGLPNVTQLVPPPPGGPGSNLFAGGQGQGQVSSMTQVVDLRDFSLSGFPTFALSGYVGGHSAQEDAATVTARFRDGRGQAAFLWPNRGGAGVDKLFVFDGALFFQIDPISQTVDGASQSIGDGWDCVWASDIDAALFADDGSLIFFFQGDRYIEYDPLAEACVDGNENFIVDRWPLLDRFAGGARDIDAAFLWRSGPPRYYFFKGEQFIRYDGASTPPNQPKWISSLTWPGLHVWSRRIDAAAAGRTNEALFFKQGWYLRYDEIGGAALPGFPQLMDPTSWNGLDDLHIGTRSAVLGPVSAADRGSLTQLNELAYSDWLPVATDQIEIEVLFTAESGASDGYVDQLWLEINPD